MILIILLSPHTAIRLESGLHADLQGPYPSSAGPYLKIYKKYHRTIYLNLDNHQKQKQSLKYSLRSNH